VTNQRRLSRICVFCGSSSAARPVFREAAHGVGGYLARRGIELVYGGGNVGLMGEVATGALGAGGRVTGVIPEKLWMLELGRTDVTSLEVVPDMHTRKKRMADLSDAFVALPGGYGTLEELFEAVTWTQLNYHLKPVGILNVDGFFDSLVAFLGRAAAEGFVRRDHVELLIVDDDIGRLVDRLAEAELPALERWIDDV
jgi:uncharacterized protein (TIGR00730 family)